MHPISAGVWYLGVPFVKAENSNIYDRDPLILLFGLVFPDFEVGYSYGFTISDIGDASGGAHEISIVYDFVAKFKKKSDFYLVLLFKKKIKPDYPN